MSSNIEESRRAIREKAALTDRHWVRLTHCCNNRCLFCLDTDAQDGTMRSAESVLKDIEHGANLGRQRLILSGGDPTIHPDLIKFIKAGKKAGFERVQLITNGRMFARKAFFDAALEAGLGELTISLHGDTPELHDKLVGVPGAFVQTVRGIKNAVDCGRLIVNVDVVVNKLNVHVVDRIIALSMKLGVHEFDLLQVQPSGSAAHNPEVLYDVAPAMESLKRVFELSRRPDLFIWTNRFPVSHLEGFEDLIQDPHKLIDETRGRFEQIVRLFGDEKTPFRCRGELCKSCYLVPLCDELHSYAARLDEKDFNELLIDLQTVSNVEIAAELLENIENIRVNARTFGQAADFEMIPTPAKGVTLVLESAEGLKEAPLELWGLPITRISSENVDVLDTALELCPEQIEVQPNQANKRWILDHKNDTKPQIVLRPAPRMSLSECLDRDLPSVELSEMLEGSTIEVEDTPLCLSGDRPVTWTRSELQPELITSPDPAELEHFIERFAAIRFRAKSVRCDGCQVTDQCHGQLVQRLRAFGLKTLEPK